MFFRACNKSEFLIRLWEATGEVGLFCWSLLCIALAIKALPLLVVAAILLLVLFLIGHQHNRLVAKEGARANPPAR